MENQSFVFEYQNNVSLEYLNVISKLFNNLADIEDDQSDDDFDSELLCSNGKCMEQITWTDYKRNSTVMLDFDDKLYCKKCLEKLEKKSW